MTDTERKRIDAICKVAKVKDIGDLSDGFHTFNSLYYQRMILFATLVKTYKDRAWKSLRHENGELCFGGGWFIVGIDTPEGSYTYHYEDNYFSLFDCEELECGKHWDGHTEKDVTRLLSLPRGIRMTLDEAIKHCEEVAKEEIVKGNLLGNHSGSFYTGNKDKCERCASEHRQLAEWLKELKWWKSLPHYCATCKYGEMGKHFSECKSCHGNSNWKCGYKGGEGE